MKLKFFFIKFMMCKKYTNNAVWRKGVKRKMIIFIIKRDDIYWLLEEDVLLLTRDLDYVVIIDLCRL